MMTTKELEQAILDFITKVYCKKYTGKIKVIETFSDDIHLGYILKLGLNKDEQPLSIAIEGTDEQFLKEVTNELRKRDLSRIEYFTAIQIYHTDECKKKC